MSVSCLLTTGFCCSRQPNPVLGLGLGEVFVQRNVGNLATHKDPNCMACLEYTVDHLKVKHVLVVGHYNCGAAACSAHSPTAGTVLICCTWIGCLFVRARVSLLRCYLARRCLLPCRAVHPAG